MTVTKTIGVALSGRARLRIMMVVDGYYPAIGGTEVQVELIAKALQDIGHSVVIVAPQLDREMPLRDEVAGVRVERVPYPHLPLLGGAVLAVRFMLKLYRERRHFDVVHVHMAKILAAAVGLVSPWTGNTSVVKISGAWEFDGGILDRHRRGAWLYRALNALVRRVDFVQSVSRYTRERLLESGYRPDQIVDIPNAIDRRKFLGRANKPVLGTCPEAIFVGRLVAVKGVDVLLRSWSSIHAATGARLTIVGDGSMRKELENLSTTLGLLGIANFLGYRSDVTALLNDSDIYVQASRREGLPNSIIEAMACGLPVVATRIGGHEDLVLDGVSGRLTETDDPYSFASAVIELLRDRDLAHRMGEAGQRIIEGRYTLEAVIPQLLTIYASQRLLQK